MRRVVARAVAVAAFRSLHPGINLTLLEAGRDQLVQDVREGDLDLAAVFDFPALDLTIDEGLEARELLEEPHDLVLRQARLAQRKNITMADLRDEDWLFPTLGPDSPTQKLFTAACAAAGYEPRIVFRVNDSEMFQALVAAGVGLRFLPRLALHPLHPGVVITPVAEAPRSSRNRAPGSSKPRRTRQRRASPRSHQRYTIRGTPACGLARRSRSFAGILRAHDRPIDCLCRRSRVRIPAIDWTIVSAATRGRGWEGAFGVLCSREAVAKSRLGKAAARSWPRAGGPTRKGIDLLRHWVGTT
jgi:hypothetical protein